MAERFTAGRDLTHGFLLDDDLRAPLMPAEQARLKNLFDTHGLLVFRGPILSHEEQIRAMEPLGPILRTSDGIGVISTDPRQGDLGSYELKFHSDLALTPKPFRAISLHAIDVVDDATATRYSSGIRAYERLPAALKARIADLRLVSAMPTDNARDQVGQAIPDGMPSHSWPLVRPHPDTGVPILYVSEQQAVHIEGLPLEESNALIRTLFSYLYAAENIYEHRWHKGDLVIWDNLVFTHARGDVGGRGIRTLQRVVVAETSFYELCPQFKMDDPAYKKWLNATSQATPETALHTS